MAGFSNRTRQCSRKGKQCAKKAVSDYLGLLDFAVRIEDSVPLANSNCTVLLEMKFRGSSI